MFVCLLPMHTLVKFTRLCCYCIDGLSDNYEAYDMLYKPCRSETNITGELYGLYIEPYSSNPHLKTRYSRGVYWKTGYDLPVSKHHDMKAYAGVKVNFSAFLNSVTVVGDR